MLSFDESSLIQSQSRIRIKNKSENNNSCCISQPELPYTYKMQHAQKEKLKALQKAKSSKKKRREKRMKIAVKVKGKKAAKSIPLIDTRLLTTVRIKKETLSNDKAAKYAPRQIPSVQQTARKATEALDLEAFLKTVFLCKCTTAPLENAFSDFGDQCYQAIIVQWIFP